jgi:putative heme degradation protein
MTDLPFIVYEFKVYVRNMSDTELHQEIVGQWKATGRDFDEDEMNIMIDELDRRSAYTKLDTSDRVLHKEWVGLTDEVRANWSALGLVGVEIVAAHLKEENT